MLLKQLFDCLMSSHRDGLLKMQDVFSKNPKMGDPASLAAQLDENSQALDKLQQEIRKYEVIDILHTVLFVVITKCTKY
jgi:hypothetical protein